MTARDKNITQATDGTPEVLPRRALAPETAASDAVADGPTEPVGSTTEDTAVENANTPNAAMPNADAAQAAEGGVPATSELLFDAHGLAARTLQGQVFGPVDWQVGASQHGAVLGEQGSGRSAFLLALAGRLKAAVGELQVGDVDGIAHPRQLRQDVSVARITDFAELEPLLTVAEAVDERALLEGMGLRKGRRSFGQLESALDLHFPYYDRVESLSAVERTLLSLALGAMRPARYIVFDDIDESLTDDQLRVVYDRMGQLGELGHRYIVSALSTSAVPDGAATLQLTPVADNDRLALSFAHLRPRRVTRKESAL